ncbi:hypothetical protein GYH30_018935 [Glycine max]|nr:hypothetical protein GYH30_018935 [Glycine max]
MMENIWQCCCDSLHVNLSDLCAALANDVACRAALGRRYWEDYVLWLDWMSKVNGLSQRAHGVAKNLDQFIDEVISDHVRNGRDGHVDVDSEEQNDFVNVLLSIEKSKTTGSTIDRTPIKL